MMIRKNETSNPKRTVVIMDEEEEEEINVRCTHSRTTEGKKKLLKTDIIFGDK